MHKFVRAQDTPNWITAEAPTLSKTTDLLSNVSPEFSNVDCDTAIMVPPGQTTPQKICTLPSPLGAISTSGLLHTGAGQYAPLEGPDYQSFFVPDPDPSVLLVSLNSPGIGNYVGVYRHITKSALRKNINPALGVYYDITQQPDALIIDPATDQPLAVDTASMAFSSDGQWMVASLPHRGLVRVNMITLGVQLFARPIEPSWFLGVAYPSLAISDDGKYVAANIDLFGTGNIIVFDTSTCIDQSAALSGQERYCAGKNILTGDTSDGKTFGSGLLTQQPDLQRPTHLRFVDDSNLGFSAEYTLASSTIFKVANFVATANNGLRHKLGLLGMGDSYISGQGEFDYRDGTDTANNTCHLSELSYPLILGKVNFNSFNSVACSGALTRNISPLVDLKANKYTYLGQVNDKIQEKDRNKSDILTNFLPGYIYQQEFASTYLPEAMVISVGGDDIGFANIVKSCVANQGGGTCYDTYEDRAELVNEIDATYSKLVDTYRTLQEQSGGARLYVVGYPQITEPGGDCGVNVHLNSKETEFSAQLISYLNSVVRQAAGTAGAFYVDTEHAFDGHRLCEAGDKAVNGFTVGEDGGITVAGKNIRFVGVESYHPTTLGHQLLAETIAAETNGLRAGMPAASAYSVPAFDPNADILQNVPYTGRPLNLVTHDDDITGDLTFSGDTQQITLDGSSVQLQPGSQYQIVLHSQPVTLGTGSVYSDGNVAARVTIPRSIPPGYHTLHVYGTDMAGRNIDVQKVIYVSDNIGGGTAADPCLFINASGQDSDNDGIDDACDPQITAAVKGDATYKTDIGVSQSTISEGVVTVGVHPQQHTQNDFVLNIIGGSAHTVFAPEASAKDRMAAVRHIDLARVHWLPVLAVSLTGISVFTIALVTLRSKHGQ